jgi:hypothetical protein
MNYETLNQVQSDKIVVTTQPCWGEGCPPAGRQGVRGDSVDWNGI